MSTSLLRKVERQAQQLSEDEQLRLISGLIHSLRQKAAGSDWSDDLAAMAADPQIRTELQEIDEEFRMAEADGLERL